MLKYRQPRARRTDYAAGTGLLGNVQLAVDVSDVLTLAQKLIRRRQFAHDLPVERLCFVVMIEIPVHLVGRETRSTWINVLGLRPTGLRFGNVSWRLWWVC